MKRYLPTLLAAACGAPEQPPAVPDPAAALAPAPEEAPVERPDFPGVVTARDSRIIPAPFQGPLDKVFVHARKRVKVGEVVARLDPRELKSEADSLAAQESSSGASADGAAAAYAAAANQARTERRLYERGFGSRNAWVTAESKARELRAQIGASSEQAKSTRMRRKQLEEQIKKADVPSPIDGVITIVSAKPGDVLARGARIATVFDDRDLLIRFAVPKEYRHLVKMGGRVELRVDGVEQPIWATIDQIADEEPPITFSIVEADIDDARLRPDEIQVARNGRVRLVDEPTSTTATTTTKTARVQPEAGAKR